MASQVNPNFITSEPVDKQTMREQFAIIAAEITALQAANEQLQKRCYQVGDERPLNHDAVPDGWLLCYGQQLSRTAYSALFAVIGTRYNLVGVPDTHFNVPDWRGVVFAGRDDMGGTPAGKLPAATAVNGTVLGGWTQAINIDHLPNHGHSFSTNTTGSHVHVASTTDNGAHTHTYDKARANGFGGGGFADTPAVIEVDNTGVAGNHNHTVNMQEAGNHSHAGTTDAVGGGDAFPIVQPTIVRNIIIYTGVHAS
jgi:microcystin-dependent protein